MSKQVVDVFEIDTNAVATNRGYYYQHLLLLKKWIENYISDSTALIFTEVDDDIKELGDSLVFTQVKCYSSNFSFQSKEVSKTLFNFFILFLKNKDSHLTDFCFSTNSAVAKNESLLQDWVDDPDLKTPKTRQSVMKRVAVLLKNEVKEKTRKKLQSTKNNKDKVNSAKVDFLELLRSTIYEDFITRIKWQFSSTDTAQAVVAVQDDISKLFSHEKFDGRPIDLIEKALLCEIYRCSQLSNEKERVLSSSTISALLEKADLEIEAVIDQRFLTILRYDYEKVLEQIKTVQSVQDNQASTIANLTSRVEIIETTEQKDTPKYLTLIPSTFLDVFHGRDHLFEDFQNRLESNRILYISGSGGEGKTFFTLNFLKQYDSIYDHVIWIDSVSQCLNAICSNTVLKDNLDIQTTPETQEVQMLQVICGKLGKLSGKNLLVIDNYSDDFETLRTITSVSNWSIIITTRESLPNINKFPFNKLGFDTCLKIYNDNALVKVEESDVTVSKFSELVDYNPLVVKLCSKMIAASLELDLKKLVELFEEQQLEDGALDVNISTTEVNQPIKLLHYLKKRFELTGLTKEEEMTLKFFALLPSSEISITLIASIGGIGHLKENLRSYANVTQTLHNKGWIERSGDLLKMHRLVQELIIYNCREDKSPFFDSFFQIIWLHHRIDEVALTNPSSGFKYVKLAESIIKTIKEPFRQSMYQPLLVLENAVLNSYNWKEKPADLHSRWIDLLARAENHLGKGDKYLGVIHNNVGFSYAQELDKENAKQHWKKAIKTFEIKSDSDVPRLLINSLNNLTQILIENGEVKEAQKLISKVEKISRSNQIDESQMIAMHNNVIGKLHQRNEDFQIAVSSFSRAISIHLDIPRQERNDSMLAMYRTNLMISQFLLGNHAEVVSQMVEIATLIKELQEPDNPVLNEVLRLCIGVRQYYSSPSDGE